MNRNIALAFGAAAGGLLAVAFLPAAVAAADSEDSAASSAATFPDAPGNDAFVTPNGIFDPITTSGSGALTEGFAPVQAEFGAPDLLEIGSNPDQQFEIFGDAVNTTPSLLGSADADENVMTLFGMTNTAFTISGVDAASGVTAGVPEVGTTYDVTSLLPGVENFYSDIPGQAGSVTDVLQTPLGSINMSSLFDGFSSSSTIDPGDAFGFADTASTSAPATELSEVISDAGSTAPADLSTVFSF